MSRRVLSRLPALSLVELLVTVMIAGFVFAAMVPLFVGAQQKNAADNLRNISLQIAQDKVEKIRQLDFDQIVADKDNPASDPNLYNPLFAGGQFGPLFIAQGGAGSKQVHIDYQVEDVPAGALEGLDECKKVTVDVWWDPPPSPVKHVKLETLVYRQYAGPQIVTFDISPLAELEPDTLFVTGSPVVMKASISAADLASMNAGGTPCGFVRFTVNGFNGARVAFAEIDTPTFGNPSEYTFSWDASTAPDGIYEFTAVGFSRVRYQGNTAAVAYRLERGAPAAVSNLRATAGNGVVYLAWDTSPAGDLSHYEIYRVDSVRHALGHLGQADTMIADNLTGTSYTDSGLTNGETYYYIVTAVDERGNRSTGSNEASAVPSTTADSDPPSVPGSLTAVKHGPSQPSILLTWTGAVDEGSPASGLLCYQLERSIDGATGWTVIDGTIAPTALAYIDSTAGYSATWHYRVRAVDMAGNASGYSNVVSATTDPIPIYSLTVRNDHETTTVYVRVQDVYTGLWYRQDGTSSASQPGEVAIGKKGKTALWDSLPAGVYTVFGRYGTSTTSKLGDTSSGPSTVVFP